MKTSIFLFWIVGIVGISQVSGQDNPTTIFLVRHAERGNDGTSDPPVSEAGINRSLKLTEVLSYSGITAVYSTNYKRTRATVEPLAKACNLDIRLYEAMKEAELKKIIEENRGGVVVICGHSNSTPWSANYLAGTKLENFSDTEYGNILIVTFWDFGNASLTRVNY